MYVLRRSADVGMEWNYRRYAGHWCGDYVLADGGTCVYSVLGVQTAPLKNLKKIKKTY